MVVTLLALPALAVGLAACGTTADTSATSTSATAALHAADQTAEYSFAGDILTLADRTIRIVEDNRGGVLATDNAEIRLKGITLVTMGTDSFGLATAVGGGSITATACKVITSGSESPCLYSRDVISVIGGTYEAVRSEVAALEPNGSLSLINAALSSKFKQCAIRLAAAVPRKVAPVTSQKPDPTDIGTASFTMSGGSLVYADKGAVFYVTGCIGVIQLSGVKMTALSGLLLKAVGMGNGSAAEKGAHVVLTADRQTLVGDISADSSSVVDLTLTTQSSLVGGIDRKDKAQEINLTLDTGSTWQMTADSYVSGLSLAGGISGTTITNIIGNGYTAYYDPGSATNSALAGKTYSLKHGGYLKPAGQ